MKKVFAMFSLLAAMIILFLSMSALAHGQIVAVKPTPASDALVHAAQDLTTEQKSFDTALNQARSTADASQKSIQAEMKKASDDLMVELKADKKYKDKLAAIDVLQKNLQNAGQQAEQKFQQEVGPIQNAIGKDKALIDGLIPVVRQENGLADTATFDSATQKWSAPKVAEKPVEAKK